jgi:hypothetical protein
MPINNQNQSAGANIERLPCEKFNTQGPGYPAGGFACNFLSVSYFLNGFYAYLCTLNFPAGIPESKEDTNQLIVHTLDRIGVIVAGAGKGPFEYPAIYPKNLSTISC